MKYRFNIYLPDTPCLTTILPFEHINQAISWIKRPSEHSGDWVDLHAKIGTTHVTVVTVEKWKQGVFTIEELYDNAAPTKTN